MKVGGFEPTIKAKIHREKNVRKHTIESEIQSRSPRSIFQPSNFPAKRWKRNTKKHKRKSFGWFSFVVWQNHPCFRPIKLRCLCGCMRVVHNHQHFQLVRFVPDCYSLNQAIVYLFPSDFHLFNAHAPISHAENTDFRCCGLKFQTVKKRTQKSIKKWVLFTNKMRPEKTCVGINFCIYRRMNSIYQNAMILFSARGNNVLISNWKCVDAKQINRWYHELMIDIDLVFICACHKSKSEMNDKFQLQFKCLLVVTARFFFYFLFSSLQNQMHRQNDKLNH